MPAHQPFMESDATGRPLVDYVWMDNRPVLQTVYDGNPTAEGTRTYLLTDHLNTPRVGLNDQQQIVWRWDDGGFGEEKADEDPDGDGHKVRINLRFPGQYYDKESGLHYNRHRYYDPTTGRYITSDPTGLCGGVNTYVYALGNPLYWTDFYGLDVVCKDGVIMPSDPILLNILKKLDEKYPDEDVVITSGIRTEHNSGQALKTALR